MVADSLPAPVGRLPFGGELPVTNTCAQNYKFTGKERDPETGNDDFGARSYSSNFGRFMSADWSAIPVPVPYANLTNPQTLNLYAMAQDNPTTFADLNGRESFRGVLPTEGMDCSEGDGNGPGCSPYPPPSYNLNAAGDLNDFADSYYQQQAQQQNANTPAPTNPNGTPTPPPTPPPPGASGKPNEWVRVPGTEGRPDKWVPRDPVPSPKGGQPGASWDEKGGHWDIDNGTGNRTPYLPDGTQEIITIGQ